MIIDGETYACEACIRGHRARSCDHHGRPLQPIRKKGRPASQCSHCRTMRKSRSAHVKCDCGKRAREAGSGSASPQGGKSKCNCFEDGRCKCAYKQEPLTRVARAQADSDDGASTSAPSVGDSACCGGSDAPPLSSHLASDESGHLGSNPWQNSGLLQLDEDPAQLIFPGLGAEWDGSLAPAVERDLPDLDSYALDHLSMPQAPLDLSSFDVINGLGDLHSTSFDDFVVAPHGILDHDAPAMDVNWPRAELDLSGGHHYDPFAGSAGPLSPGGLDQNVLAASDPHEQAIPAPDAAPG